MQTSKSRIKVEDAFLFVVANLNNCLTSTKEWRAERAAKVRKRTLVGD